MKTVLKIVVAAIVVLTLASGGTARADIVSNLENHYSFANPADPFADDSGNLRHGTNYGASWVDDPMLGGVAEFSSSDYVLADIPNLNTTGEFTVALWANIPLISGNRGFFQVQNGGTVPSGTGKVLGGWVNPTTISGRRIDTAGQADLSSSGPPSLPLGTWTHIAYQGDGSNLQRYVNGEAAGPALAYNGTLAAHDTLIIGRQGSESAVGQIGDFRVYSRALSEAEMRELVNSAQEASLAVDFNLGTGPTQPDWQPFAGGSSYTSATLPVTASYPQMHLAGLGNSVDVTLDTTAPTLYFRNYQPVTGSDINDVLRDDALLNAPGVLSLTLDNLLAGEYEITTYHHSTYQSQSRSTHCDIYVSDLLGTDRIIDTNVACTFGSDVSNYTSRTFRIWASTSGPPVEIMFDVLDADGPNHFPLSGFHLIRIPEPTTFTLLAFGAIILLPLSRRRR